MHRAIAAWLTQHPGRAAIASAICGALAQQTLLPFMIVAGAIPVLVALQQHLAIGFVMAVTGAVAAAWLELSVTEPSFWVAVGIGLLFFGPWLLGALIRRTQSLNLAFQLAVLGAGACLIVIHLSFEDPVGVWAPLLQRVLESMEQAGIRVGEDRDVVVALWARTMWGALAALVLAAVFGSVLLGRWWHSLLNMPGGFGEEYRQLRLGRVLGLSISLLFVAAVLVDEPLVASLVWVAFTALAFQGLAAAHRSKARGRINRGWLAAIYVLLVVPLSMSLTVFVLAIWGFADNWMRPRVQQV